jgi:mRNA interferase MazF
MNADYAQFNVYWCNLEPTFGHQMKKTRPCVIVSPDEMNNVLGTVIIVPLTSTLRKFPFYVQVIYGSHKGALACDQIKTIDKKRVGKHFASLTKKDVVALSNTLSAMFKSDF